LKKVIETRATRHSSRTGFKDKPGMLARIKLGPAYGEAKLKWHIEARCAGRISIQLNTGEIVNRIPATMDQRQDSIQSALTSGDSKRGARFKAKLSQTNNVGKIKAAKAFVVRDVHEYSICANWWRHACSFC
jgi:hypothetical protein